VSVVALCGCGSEPQHAQRHVPTAPVHRHVSAGPPPGWRASPRARVPILMYHVIASGQGQAQSGLYVPPALFAGTVRRLAAAGFHGVTLQQVWNAWHDGGPLPRKPVVVSFDDGYPSQYTEAFPVLRSVGWPGVLNLEVATLHSGFHASQVRGLIAAGWEIDAHTMTHPDLTTVGAARLRYEVAGSRDWIRQHFHVPVRFFCYPSGRYDATVMKAVSRAHFLAATTTQAGVSTRATPVFQLPRIRVLPSDSPMTVERLVAAAG
jgi:peptidoglycan/xylan/chitin deacetylase (PgdA/CDA1 family)